MKKILITGVTGFIGTHLIPQLIENHKVVGISKNKIKSSKNFISSSVDITNKNFKIKNNLIKRKKKKKWNNQHTS